MGMAASVSVKTGASFHTMEKVAGVEGGIRYEAEPFIPGNIPFHRSFQVYGERLAVALFKELPQQGAAGALLLCIGGYADEPEVAEGVAGMEFFKEGFAL